MNSFTWKCKWYQHFTAQKCKSVKQKQNKIKEEKKNNFLLNDASKRATKCATEKNIYIRKLKREQECIWTSRTDYTSRKNQNVERQTQIKCTRTTKKEPNVLRLIRRCFHSTENLSSLNNSMPHYAYIHKSILYMYTHIHTVQYT